MTPEDRRFLVLCVILGASFAALVIALALTK